MTQVAVDRSELKDQVYLRLTGDDEGRLCKDIPESACQVQPDSFLRHVVALTLTKSADGLVDAKLVLPWLLGALGAPAFFVGLLVPIREAGALLPQLVIAARIRALPVRERAWAAGSFVQGSAVLGMAGAALTLEGAALGWAVVLLLAVLAIARSVCSVAYKDVLGKTVSKATRGAATGTAGSIAALSVFVFGAALTLGVLPLTVPTISIVLAVAGVLWIVAAAGFAGLREAPGATEGGRNGLSAALEQFSLLGRDGQLVRFIVARGLLTATALAPPFLVALGGQA